jgi:hypothetical protein
MPCKPLYDSFTGWVIPRRDFSACLVVVYVSALIYRIVTELKNPLDHRGVVENTRYCFLPPCSDNDTRSRRSGSVRAVWDEILISKIFWVPPAK